MLHDPPKVIEQRIGEPAEVPLLDLVLGWGAMLPFPAATLAAWLGWAEAVGWIVLWGGAVLCFLSGVRRGLSFRAVGGPTLLQLAVFAWLFAAGLAALVVPWPALALLILIMGFGSLVWLDPAAAERGEAPLYFARLRPWQMAVPVASLIAMMPLMG